ncbi:unnamed protein product [Porites evermanni]|uniref:Uncharacterized protein n=1 Tax=Porites evermanni TaxID=104178 RepID=A0ABN8LLU2_9CNID|nr:unnamed protein product [Porites evermanni]
MQSPLISWFIAFFMAVAASTQGSPDKCVAAVKSLEATVDKRLQKLEADVRAIYLGLNPQGTPFKSCREIYLKHKSQVNKAYFLQIGSRKIPVYCHMGNYGIGACGGGGWTMVMKIDGQKSTFHYASKLWNNKNEFNLPGGRTGFDHKETKLPTYWNLPFSQICLAMKMGQQIRSFVMNKHANSLYSLIADNRYRSTSLGRNMWKTLIGSQASLQSFCNKKGFNVVGWSYQQSKARIGIISNNQNDCSTCDSRIGFGTGGLHDDSNSCGNEATHSPDNGDKHIKTMGYILVK